MAEPLKNFFSPALVRQIASNVSQAESSFRSRAFVLAATKGLEKLELLDRAKHIASALHQHLPTRYPEAIDTLLRSLGPEHATDELVGVGMAPFFYLPHVLFVAEYGLDDFDLSMRAQYELTKRFSAEFSIRVFIAQDPERTLATLHRWTQDENAHVRRLASEGTRLRLPWAMRVRWLDDNPDRVLQLLERLKDDPASLVRRSVANNLNDLGKVHPERLLQTAEAWLQGASTERRALIEHALRSAVKRGEPGALKLLGYGSKPSVQLEGVKFQPKRVAVGSSVLVSFSVRSTAKRTQDLLVDLAVHFVKASGKAAPKVFKLKRVALPAGEELVFEKRISLAEHTTRKPRPGRHAVDVLINGTPTPVGSFTVVATPPP